MWENPPGNEEWRRLYEAAAQVKRQAPWEWMTEADNFGVQDPDTGQLVFVSVMGMLGEHFAVALYPDAAAFHKFMDLDETGSVVAPEAVLEIPQLQASLEDRDMLHQRDRDIIKSLGLKFWGRNAWPMFRTYRPGFPPGSWTGRKPDSWHGGWSSCWRWPLDFRKSPASCSPLRRRDFWSGRREEMADLWCGPTSSWRCRHRSPWPSRW